MMNLPVLNYYDYAFLYRIKLETIIVKLTLAWNNPTKANILLKNSQPTILLGGTIIWNLVPDKTNFRK